MTWRERFFDLAFSLVRYIRTYLLTSYVGCLFRRDEYKQKKKIIHYEWVFFFALLF